MLLFKFVDFSVQPAVSVLFLLFFIAPIIFTVAAWNYHKKQLSQGKVDIFAWKGIMYAFLVTWVMAFLISLWLNDFFA